MELKEVLAAVGLTEGEVLALNPPRAWVSAPTGSVPNAGYLEVPESVRGIANAATTKATRVLLDWVSDYLQDQAKIWDSRNKGLAPAVALRQAGLAITYAKVQSLGISKPEEA